MSSAIRVALLGFSDFERSTLAAFFRLADRQRPAYVLTSQLDGSFFVVADADHAPSVRLAAAAGRVDDTVYIGSQPPDGASAWMTRPIDPLRVRRELDAMLALRTSPPPVFDEAATIEMAPADGLQAAPGGDTASAAAPRDGAAGPRAAATAATPVVARIDDATARDDGAAHGLPTPAPARGAAEPACSATPAEAPRRGTDDAATWIVPPPAPPPRALLVDDSPIALRFLQQRLERWGIGADTAATSGGALALLVEKDYDFVFVDIELGDDSELDGLALCQHIKRHQSAHSAIASSVFIVSAHHGELDRVRGRLAGCDAFLEKPLHDDALQRLLQGHGLGPQPAPPPRRGRNGG